MYYWDDKIKVRVMHRSFGTFGGTRDTYGMIVEKSELEDT
jgi:hypothetical protein